MKYLFTTLLLSCTCILFSACNTFSQEPFTGLPDFRVPPEDLHTRTLQALAPCLQRLERVFDVRWPRNEYGLPKGVSLSIENTAKRTGLTKRGRITLSQASLYAGPEYYETTFCHEVVHAFQQRMFHHYSTIPGWQREGFAVYASGQLKFKRYERIAHPELISQNIHSVPQTGSLPFSRYMEAAMVFEYLHFKLRSRWIPFLRAWRASSNLGREAQRFLQLSEHELLQVAKRWSRLRYSIIRDRLGTDYWEARALGLARSQEVIDRLEPQLLSAQGQLKSPKEAFSAVLLLNAYRMLRLYGDGIKLSEALLQLPVWMHGDQTAMIHATTGYLELDSGFPERALFHFQKVYAFHSEHAILQNSMIPNLGRAYFDMKDFELSLYWLEQYRPVGTYVDNEIHARKVIAEFHLGRQPRSALEALLQNSLSQKARTLIESALEEESDDNLHPFDG